MIHQDVFIGVGSNLGNRFSSISFALEQIGLYCRDVKVSSLYESSAQGFARQPSFINCVFQVVTSLSPWNMLKLIGKIEMLHSKSRIFPNAPRSLDLDILFWGNRKIHFPGLCVPHPRVLERGFVLAPLLELRPALYHPTGNKLLRDVYEVLPIAQKPIKLNAFLSRISDLWSEN